MKFKTEKVALQSLKRDTNIVVFLSADKRNTIVVLDSKNCNSKITTFMFDSPFL